MDIDCKSDIYSPKKRRKLCSLIPAIKAADLSYKIVCSYCYVIKTVCEMLAD